MQAVRAHGFDGIDALVVEDIPRPEAEPGSVVVDLEATGVNFADALMVSGQYQLRPDLPFSPGFEGAGTIAAIGEGVTGLEEGEPVVVTTYFGTYSEAARVTPDQIITRPAGVSPVTAVATAVAFGTAYHGLIDRGALAEGETLLVTGATGGVGSATLLLGRSLGARVIAAVGSSTKEQAARDIGAHEVVSYEHLEEYRGALQSVAPEGIDMVLDTVGGDVFEPSLRSLRPGGRALVVGFAAGGIPRINTNLLLLKEASAVGVFWGAFRQRHPVEAAAQLSDVWQQFAEGRLALPPIQTAPLADASAVLRRLLDREIVGRAVLLTNRR